MEFIVSITQPYRIAAVREALTDAAKAKRPMNRSVRSRDRPEPAESVTQMLVFFKALPYRFDSKSRAAPVG